MTLSVGLLGLGLSWRVGVVVDVTQTADRVCVNVFHGNYNFVYAPPCLWNGVSIREEALCRYRLYLLKRQYLCHTTPWIPVVGFPLSRRVKFFCAAGSRAGPQNVSEMRPLPTTNTTHTHAHTHTRTHGRERGWGICNAGKRKKKKKSANWLDGPTTTSNKPSIRESNLWLVPSS